MPTNVIEFLPYLRWTIQHCAAKPLPTSHDVVIFPINDRQSSDCTKEVAATKAENRLQHR